MDTDLRVLEMSLALARPSEPKVFCTSHLRNKWGWVASRCSFHAGHENDHRDVHNGATWSD